MSEFLNPYQFIPVTGKINEARPRIPATDIASGSTTQPARHDLWQPDMQSGRIVCRLHLDTPIVVGCEQLEDRGTPSKRVVPYRRNDQPAIPGSSLRGMVSSLAEALSQSSLRVLEDRDLVVRLAAQRRIPLAAGAVHEYFRAIDPDLVPWKAPNPLPRNLLTPAELLFGVVDERGDDSDDDADPPFHLASRVRFSDALPHPKRPPIPGPEVMLKELAGPKGYPAMYFHPDGRRGDFVAKEAFYKPNGSFQPAYRPNGRKVYLHHGADDVREAFWVTRNYDPKSVKRKVRCTPICNHRYGDADSDLWFHIDFENLSNAELTLLVASLRPSQDLEFRHRLGLGKPLGLGTVKVAIEGAFLIDRVARYTNALDAARYHSAWRAAALATEYPWAWRYPEEAKQLSLMSPPALDASPRPNFWDPNRIDDKTLAIVKTLGDPALVQAPVHTPTVDGYGPEKKTFEWFVQNETAVGPQALPKVDPGRPLTILRSYPRLGGGRPRR